MRVRFDVLYKIGQKIKGESKIYVVIGYEFIPGRATRYILLHSKNGEASWEYMYDFEINALTV